MAARTTCVIEFDNNAQKVFYGGQLLSGRVTLTLHKEKTVRGISIKIDGRAYCRWTTGSGDSKKTHIGEETYLSERTYFLGDKTGEIELQPGVYTYTFQCHLPVGLPTSVEATHGHIRYSATVNLDRPLWPDQEFEEGFTVLKPLDLNDLQHLRFPHAAERRKTFSLCCLFCCCQSAPLFITCRLPCTGFTPGDTIALLIEARNDSDLDVESFRVCIDKQITFRVSANSSRQKLDTVTIAECTAPRGCAQKSADALQIDLDVPALPPTDTTTSTICAVEYVMKVQGIVPCCHADPELKIPITIGTVPFFNNRPMPSIQPTILAPYPFLAEPTNIAIGAPVAGLSPPYPTDVITSPPRFAMPMPMPATARTPVPQPMTAPTAPSDACTVEPSAPRYDPMTLYTDCDPPTYEQAISGQADIQGKMFAPFYPVFRRNRSTVDAVGQRPPLADDGADPTRNK